MRASAIQEHRVNVCGSEIPVRQAGERGQTVILIHGAAGDRREWTLIMPALSAYNRVYAPDLIGFGESPRDDITYTIGMFRDFIIALMDELGIQDTVLIGHSLGGMIGPAYAHAYAHHTLSVSLLSTAAGRTEDDRAKLQAVIAAMEEKGIAPVLETLVARWYTDEFIAARPDLIEARIKQVNDTPDDVFLSVFHVYAETEMAPWLHEISCPCLLMTGEMDGACSPRHNRFMADELRNSELVILDNIKHSILIEGPDRVAPRVREFLLKHRN